MFLRLGKLAVRNEDIDGIREENLHYFPMGADYTARDCSNIADYKTIACICAVEYRSAGGR